MHTAGQIRQVANFKVKAELGERLGRTDQQNEHVENGQVDQEAKCGHLAHMPLAKHEYVDRVAHEAYGDCDRHDCGNVFGVARRGHLYQFDGDRTVRLLV